MNFGTIVKIVVSIIAAVVAIVVAFAAWTVIQCRKGDNINPKKS